MIFLAIPYGCRKLILNWCQVIQLAAKQNSLVLVWRQEYMTGSLVAISHSVGESQEVIQPLASWLPMPHPPHEIVLLDCCDHEFLLYYKMR